MGVLSPTFSPDLVKRIDHADQPASYSCQFCNGALGKTEEVWTGGKDSNADSGFEVWFRCDACLEAGQPCETFYLIRLLPEPGEA